MQLGGKCPQTWAVPTNINPVNVDDNGDIIAGDIAGFVEVLDPNRIRLQFSGDPLNWNAGQSVLSGYNAAPITAGLEIQDLQSWQDWAGSMETLPANDRRLIEVFGEPGANNKWGRVDVNSDKRAVWAGILCGLSVPQWAHPSNQNGIQRIPGANEGASEPANWRVDFNDGKWVSLVKAINELRGEGMFTRTTDILGVSELSDLSPYSVQGVTGVDELDLERLPNQILSMLKTGGPSYYQLYVFVENIKPSRTLKLAKDNERSGIDAQGNVLNYETTKQMATRQLVRFFEAEELLEFLEIQAIRKTSVGQLSYGLQKRVELGRALAAEPKCLLLDEPMAGMSPDEKQDMTRFILQAKEAYGMTVVLIAVSYTHLPLPTKRIL